MVARRSGAEDGGATFSYSVGVLADESIGSRQTPTAPTETLKSFMTKIKEHSPAPSSVPSMSNETTPSPLDLLTPDDLPGLQPSHPDEFAGEDARPDTPA